MANAPEPAQPVHAPLGLAVFAGPTGGHLFPAQSFSEAFRKHFPGSVIDLVTCCRARPMVDKMPQGIFRSVTYLPEFGFSAGFSLKTLKPFALLPYLFVQAFSFLRRTRPHLCVGFGSFVSYPGMMTAHALGIPTLIHEQNKIPGKATHWLVPHMDAVAESFEGTRFRKTPKRLHTVGLPLRTFILDSAGKSASVSMPRLLTVLVVGGSQGAQGLNAVVTEAFASLSDEERSKIAVIHITGNRDAQKVAEHYARLGMTSEVHPFYGAMDELFRKVDLAVTRAGANTLFELALFGIPALVIPYPHAGGHQKYNAQAFAERGGLTFHDENAGAKDWLVTELRKAIEDPGSLAGMSGAIRKLAKPQATDRLIEIARKMIETHENHPR